MSKCAGAIGGLLEQITQMIEPVPKAPKVQPAAPVEAVVEKSPAIETRFTVGLFIVPPVTPVLKVIPLSNCATLVGLARVSVRATVILPALVVNTAVTPLAPLNVNVPA